MTKVTKREPELTQVLTIAQQRIQRYDEYMIKTFKHKGLQKFFTTGSTVGIQSAHKLRIEERLQALHTAISVDDMDLPGWRLHGLKGDRAGLWAINVSGNWRIVFEFVDGHAYIVNYEDYH